MAVKTLFPTRIYAAPLGPRSAALNHRLLDQCEALAADDLAGRRWSQKHYLGGYTSYGSLCRLQETFAVFAELERRLKPHAEAFAKALRYDLSGHDLAMTDCWANIMPAQVTHSFHIHPLSFLSGTYYLQIPPKAAPIKFEDPRLGFMMSAPPRLKACPPAERPFYSLKPKSGDVVLFESWLRHEVPASDNAAERISISFNYALLPKIKPRRGKR